ncbi:MAG: hypothetical protein K6T29_06765 [Peptococcaceae bacterium]|nr:hypothetical protein [Peptococcaceae bacterium]
MNGWTVLMVIPVMLAAGLLIVPVTFNIKGLLRTGEGRLEAGIAWGWGLVAAAVETGGRETAFGIRLAGMSLPVSRKKTGAARAKKAGKKKGRKRERRGFNLSAAGAVFDRKLQATVLGCLKGVYKSFRLRVRLRGVYGTGDPALTGMLAGLAAVLNAGNIDLGLEPDFSGPALDLTGEISGRIVPVVILWFAVRLLLAGPVRGLWWTRLKTKFIKRKPEEVAEYV